MSLKAECMIRFLETPATSQQTVLRAPSILFLTIGLILTGCTGSGVPLGKVTGTIRLDGHPLKDALVKFIPVSGGRTALGNTDHNGRYEMRYTASSTGSPVGKVKVEITTAMEYQDEQGRTQHRPELLPDRYHQKSELLVDVTQRSNHLDFDLKSD